MKRSYLGYDIPSYRERLEKAIFRYGRPPDMTPGWATDIDKDSWDYLGYMQPSAAMYWQCYLKAALETTDTDFLHDLHMITIIDKRWHFGKREWRFAQKRMEYQLRRALKGLNYLVIIEFEVFRNVRHLNKLPAGSVAAHEDHGCVIAPHFQGFIWGKRPSRRQRRQFAGGLFNAPGVKAIRVEDFLGALRYTGKPPYRGRSIYRSPTGRLVRRVWPEMSLTLHHLLLCKLHHYRWPELTFASGEGRAVLAQAKRLWRNYVPGAISNYDDRPPLLSGLEKRWY